MLAPPAPTSILLAEGEDGGFCVTVLPPPEGPGHDQCFDGYLVARAYARLLRIGHGWRIVDRVQPATIRAAEAADQARRNG